VKDSKTKLDEAAVVAALKELRNIHHVAVKFGASDWAINKIQKAHKIEILRRGNPRKDWDDLLAEFEKVRNDREALEDLARRHKYRNVDSLRNSILHKAGRRAKAKSKDFVLLTHEQYRIIRRQNLDDHQAALRVTLELGKRITANDVSQSRKHWRAVEEQEAGGKQ
jgi:hypothetical protein